MSENIAILWPRPRANRWLTGDSNTPDQSDALSHLEAYGFQVEIEESMPFPLNPLARMHEFWSGLDPIRAARLWARSRKYDLVIGVGDAVAYYPMLAQQWLSWKMPFVMVDPALSHEYPRRQRLQDFVLPRAERVIVFGQVQLEYLRERYGNRVRAELVLHRADTEFYSPEDNAPRATSGDYIVSVGGDKSRDFHTLVAAIQIARSTAPELRCVIKTPLDIPSGPGITVDRTQSSWRELRQLYRDARFVVLPLHDSLHAGGINTLVEAMSIGKGVIVSDSRGIREYVRHGETAEVVLPGCPDSLAKAIVRHWQDPSIGTTMGEKARTFAVDNCANRIYASRIANILHDVLGSSPKARQHESNKPAQKPSAQTVGSESVR